MSQSGIPGWFELAEKANTVATMFKGNHAVADAALAIAESGLRRARVALTVNADISEDMAEAAELLDRIAAAGGVTDAELDEQLARLQDSSALIATNTERLRAQQAG